MGAGPCRMVPGGAGFGRMGLGAWEGRFITLSS
jgi:hypothetical protein